MPRTAHTTASAPNCEIETETSQLAVADFCGANVIVTGTEPFAGTIPVAGITENKPDLSPNPKANSKSIGTLHLIDFVIWCERPTSRNPKSIVFGNKTSFATG